MVTKEQVENVAYLCKLKLTEEEKDRVLNEMNDILKQLETFNKVDLDNVKPTLEVIQHTQKFREDIIKDSLSKEEVLKNTAEKQYGYFKLLKIVE